MPTHQPRRPVGRSVHTPPYGLHLPVFPFPALACLAGDAPLGGRREAALATLMGLRLVHATLPPYQLTPEQRDVRVAAALAWLSALAIEASLRPLLQALYEAAGGQGTHHGAATALQAVRGELGNALDSRSAAELDALASRLTQAAVPSSSSEEGDAAGPARARDRSPG